MAQRNRQYRHAGFTLIEAALTTVIVGTGVLAILAAQQAFHIKNDWAQRSGTGMLLANELRELTLTMPLFDPFEGRDSAGPEAGEATVADFNDLDDFAGPVDASGYGAGMTIDPPINALRQPIAGLPGWSQHIDVVNVTKSNIGLIPPATGADVALPLIPSDPDGQLRRVTVSVRYQPPNATDPLTITQLTWVVGQ